MPERANTCECIGDCERATADEGAVRAERAVVAESAAAQGASQTLRVRRRR
jgi:hypothetical protein